ncbi:hypothetical protein LJK88_36170 [Paenibacillus sp. P26]|nr:hypothetical protein LJK88_36170 [Paenibacillus sp. P26]UUZ93574.1 hypothetical protein LJK87_02080 [Paenibacillus sp. P25]
MEKTIYEIKYNDWFTIRMESEREPMEEIEFDKAALEAVLADIVMRGKEQSNEVEKEALWRWICTQVGLALQNTGLISLEKQEPLDSLMEVVPKLKG